MDLDVFEETRKQIELVQTWITRYNLRYERLRGLCENYTPPSIYFTLRDRCEALRINKLRLNQVKNSIDVHVGDN